MAWSLARKVSVALIAILFFAMVTAAAFGAARFQDLLSSLVQSRYSFVVFTIKRKVEDSLNLGFSLRQLRQVQEIIELEKAREDQIQGIEVFDANGEVLFDTDRGGMGARVPPSWLTSLAAAAHTPAEPFALREDDVLAVGMPLVNTLGKVEGAVILRTPATALDREVGRLLRGLAPDVLLTLAGCAFFGVAASYLLLRQVGRRLGLMQDILDQTMAEGGDAVAAPDADAFEHRFAAFCGTSRAAIDLMDETAADVERADRLM